MDPGEAVILGRSRTKVAWRIARAVAKSVMKASTYPRSRFARGGSAAVPSAPVGPYIRAAEWAQQRVDLVDSCDQLGPSEPGLAGESVDGVVPSWPRARLFSFFGLLALAHLCDLFIPGEPRQGERTADHVTAEPDRPMPVFDPNRTVDRETAMTPSQKVAHGLLPEQILVHEHAQDLGAEEAF